MSQGMPGERSRSAIWRSLGGRLAKASPWRSAVYLARAVSSNEVVKDLLAKGRGLQTVVFVEDQTGGKGRFDRRWVSTPLRSLAFSVAVPGPKDVSRPGLVPLAAALSVRSAIAAVTGLEPWIKWPNDVLIADKKVCGILARACHGPPGESFIILGIGINVNQRASDFPGELAETATSLRMQVGRRVPRVALARRVLIELGRKLRSLQSPRSHEIDSLLREYALACSTLGRDVQVETLNGAVRGRAEEIASDGALVIRLFRSRRRTAVREGDVIHLRS